MDLYVKIVALDEQNGVKKTIEKTVPVPPGVIKMVEMFHGGDAGERVTQVATSAAIAALQTIDVGRKNEKKAMEEVVSKGGMVGGPKGAPATDPMMKALGLDMIESMNSGQSRAASGPVAGFGDARDRNRGR